MKKDRRWFRIPARNENRLMYLPPKIVFAHIPKTAGTSVVSWIQRHYRYEDVLHEASHWAKLAGHPSQRWSEKRFVRGHFGSYICKHFPRPRGFLRIALLRDPVERAISHYWHYRKAVDVPKKLRRLGIQDLNFDEFLEHPATRTRASNFQLTHLGFDLAADLAASRVTKMLSQGLPATPATLAFAKQFIDSCEVVGTTERLGQFVAGLSHLLKSPFADDLERVRRYQPVEFTAPGDNRSRLKRLNEADYELYAYAQHAMQTRLTRKSRFKISATPLRSNPPVDASDASELTWGVKEPFFGAFWSDVQCAAHATIPPHRWSVGARGSWIWFRAKRWRFYRLRIRILRFVSAEQREGLRCKVNRRPVRLRSTGLDETHGPSGGTYEGLFFSGPSARLKLLLAVKQPQSFSDVDSFSRDQTPRGLALCSLSLERVPSGSARRTARTATHSAAATSGSGDGLAGRQFASSNQA